MNKASGGDGIPAEIFQTLRVLHSLYQQIWKRAVATGLEKVSFPIPEKGNAKDCSNNCTHFTC